MIDQARRVAASSLRPRLARLQRRLRSRLTRAIAREQALSQALIESRCPEQSQPGLFDRRDVRRHDQALRDVDILRDEAERRVRELIESADVEMGRPALELILK